MDFDAEQRERRYKQNTADPNKADEPPTQKAEQENGYCQCDLKSY